MIDASGSRANRSAHLFQMPRCPLDGITALSCHVAHVVRLRPEKEMLGANTSAIVAAVQHLEAGRNRSVCHEPRETMRGPADCLDPYESVAPSPECPCPFPALLALGDLCPEALTLQIRSQDRRRLWHVLMLSPSSFTLPLSVRTRLRSRSQLSSPSLSDLGCTAGCRKRTSTTVSQWIRRCRLLIGGSRVRSGGC